MFLNRELWRKLFRTAFSNCTTKHRRRKSLNLFPFNPGLRFPIHCAKNIIHNKLRMRSSRKYRNGQRAISIYRLNYDIFILRFYSIQTQRNFPAFPFTFSLQKCRLHNHERFDKSKEYKNVLWRANFVF